MNAADVIRIMNLEPLDKEGGFFKRTYTSAQTAEYMNAVKPIVSAIYYLITPDNFSALHILKRDEIFHFYAGDTIEFIKISADGKSETIMFGNDIEKGDAPQVVVPGGIWQGLRISERSKTKNGWALVGTTVSPAFEYDDFHVGTRAELKAKFPHLTALVERYTREKI